MTIVNLVSDMFMGDSPRWYKRAVALFLVLNPLSLIFFGPFYTGWIILLEFIATLVLALQCYPLLPGGLLALEAAFLGLVTPQKIFEETHRNFDVILLLIFMISAVYFMKPLLSRVFTKIIFSSRNKTILSLQFLVAGAFLSAWLDALTVIAVMITVAVGLYDVAEHLKTQASEKDFEEFSGFLRNLLMHGAIGTCVGGVATLVGEPQNILIANTMGWNFKDFYFKMAHISIPVQGVAILTCIVLETFRLKIFGFGYIFPEKIRILLKESAENQTRSMNNAARLQLMYMALAALWLIAGLTFRLAAVGFIGLSVIIFLCALTGKSQEEIGEAFREPLPFTALLVVFFAMVAMIDAQNLFRPVIDFALQFHGQKQLQVFFLANGLLSAISDNVFVATIYITEVQKAFMNGLIDRAQFDKLAVVINAGTNILSVATPNGQAAFIYLLTHGLAKKIKLSYVEMFKLALPYTVVLGIISFFLI